MLMGLLPYLYILLVIVLQSIVNLLPTVSSMFAGGGYSASFFTAAFISAHWAIFWPRLRSYHILLLMGILVGYQYLTFLWIGMLPPVFQMPWVGILDISGVQYFEMGIVYRTLAIQLPIYFVVFIGLWIGKKFDRFTIRRAGLDHEEQEILFGFRIQATGEDENIFYRYSALLSRSLSVVGVKRNRIVSCLSSVRLDDIIYMYDLYVDPKWTQEDTDIAMVSKIIESPEIQTSSVNYAAILFPENTPEIEDLKLRLGNLGFTDITESSHDYVVKSINKVNNILHHKYPDWNPFDRIKQMMLVRLDKQKEGDTENTSVS